MLGAGAEAAWQGWQQALKGYVPRQYLILQPLWLVPNSMDAKMLSSLLPSLHFLISIDDLFMLPSFDCVCSLWVSPSHPWYRHGIHHERIGSMGASQKIPRYIQPLESALVKKSEKA